MDVQNPNVKNNLKHFPKIQNTNVFFSFFNNRFNTQQAGKKLVEKVFNVYGHNV